MKVVLGVVGAAVVAAFLMVGWSWAGRLMTTKDDMSFVHGLLIAALLVGAVASAVAFGVKKLCGQKKEERAPAETGAPCGKGGK